MFVLAARISRSLDTICWPTSQAVGRGWVRGGFKNVPTVRHQLNRDRPMRQAVVVIHGIGEQQPMGTIRSFVDAVLPSEGEVPAYYSKPDRLSELFELRRLQATGSWTDFYE